MKRLFILLSAVLVWAGYCCSNCKAEDLINYVPADAEGIAFIDMARLMNLSQLQELRQDNTEFNSGWQEFEAQLKTYGLTKEDLPAQIMLFLKGDAVQNAGILALTKITEKKLLDLLNANKDKVSYAAKTIAGRKAYVLTKKGAENDKTVITYLKPNLVLICDEDKAGDFCGSAGKAKNEKLLAADKKADKKALIYVLYANSKPAPPQPAADTDANPMSANPLQGIDAAMLALDLTGKEQKNVSLKADLKCVDAQNAMQMTMQLKTFVMIMEMQMGQDPALGKTLTEAIKIEQQDKDVKVAVSISEELMKKLKESAKQRREKALAEAKAAAETDDSDAEVPAETAGETQGKTPAKGADTAPASAPVQ